MHLCYKLLLTSFVTFLTLTVDSKSVVSIWNLHNMDYKRTGMNSLLHKALSTYTHKKVTSFFCLTADFVQWQNSVWSERWRVGALRKCWKCISHWGCQKRVCGGWLVWICGFGSLFSFCHWFGVFKVVWEQFLEIVFIDETTSSVILISKRRKHFGTC